MDKKNAFTQTENKSLSAQLDELLTLLDPSAKSLAEFGVLRVSTLKDKPELQGMDKLWDLAQQTQSRAQELIDALRIRIKYQNFDLEVTRRENRYLRGKLET